MSVESAKAKLDAQPGDPATGYISKADHQDSYTELVDDTALTGATTAEALTISGTLNGRDPDNLVAGPASATDNALVRFDGVGGKTVQNSGTTLSDTGKLTVVATAANGVELNASGPRIMSGTGSPEGVVTAPVGSRWIRTDGDTLGDFEYTKRSGTGNTGWQVTVGDTGWRAMTLDNSWTGTLRVRRVGPQVEWRGKITAPGGGGTGYPLIALPTGYSPGSDSHWYFGTPVRSATTGDMGWVEVDVGIYMRGVAANVYPVWITYLTTAAWPTALPGSAA